jgi:DNA repair protein SbcC/Rad50
MRLKTLHIENFRCFAEVNLELNGMGLIGVRGRNGAGKSSLLEAIDFALYGQRYGLPSRRSSAGAGERLQVYVEFDFDARRVEVERTDHEASLAIDGVRQSVGKDETSRQVSRLLGLSRQQFEATFYARQKEIQSFGDKTTRRTEIERLLGLAQLRRATQLANEHARRQLVVVETLQANADDVAEAKVLLEKRREQAKQNAPLVVAARAHRDDLLAQRVQAWEQLEEAQHRATQAEQARSAHQLAAREHSAADENHRVAAATLEASREAVAEIERLETVGARAGELEAQVREHELRRQAHEGFVATRDARAEVQRKHVALTEKLRLQPLTTPTTDELKSSAGELRARQDELSQNVMASTERVATLLREHEEAQHAHEVRVRLAELDSELAAFPDVQKDEARARRRQTSLEAQRTELEHRLEAERAHREEVKRDGPDAECPRCRRVYGGSFDVILRGFGSTIAELEEQLADLAADAEKGRKSHQRCLERLERMQRLRGERDSLPKVALDTPDSPETARRAHREAERFHAQLREDLRAVGKELASIEARLTEAAKREAARHELLVQLGQLEAEEGVLSTQLKTMGDASYDSDAHKRASIDYQQASQAANRCAELRHQADSIELAQQRVKSSERTLREAAAARRAAETALLAHEGDQERLAAIQQGLRAMEEDISEAEEQLHAAEQRAISEDQDVRAAESAVRRAQAERRKVQAAKREHRYSQATADGLQAYTAHAQRNAVPRLEKDTAEFLSRLTANRYSDVLLDDSGGLAIFDDGVAEPLKRFSGGEQDLANLCLRLALSGAFADQRSADPGLIILDEVFGSQDLDRRQSLLEHFRELNKVFSQVFIVSHFDDVADACDIQIDVERAGNVSSAKLVG